MGFDLNLFVDSVDEELICSICCDVLQEAVQLMPCQHLYCRQCLTNWLSVKSICPVDGQSVAANLLTPVPRSIANMLSKLNIRCDRCHRVFMLDKYRSHNCFQEILTEMRDYIQQIDDLLVVLELNGLKISGNI